MPNFVPHKLEWTSEKVRRFWNWYSANVPGDTYFTKKVGFELVARMQRAQAISSPVLDYGCGPGHLLKHLLAQGHLTVAADTSDASLESVSRAHGDHPSFQGTRNLTEGAAIEKDHYATIFFVETIEHILPGDIPQTLETLCSYLRPGGKLILTTPNEEDLAAKSVVCTDCGAEFHRMQHISSFSASSLTRLLKDAGFSQVETQTTFLNGRDDLLWRARKRLSMLRGNKGGNLIAIATR